MARRPESLTGGRRAIAVEDPVTWTYERVEQALDDLLRRFGIEDRECVDGRGSVAHQKRVTHEKPVAHQKRVTHEKPVAHQQPEED